jgi:hypothetical protein
MTQYRHIMGNLSVGTLRAGYPHVQATNQDNGSRLPTEGSSGAVTCPRGSSSRSWLGATTCPHGSGSRFRLEAAPGPPRVPAAQGSSGTATYPQALQTTGK